MNILIDAERCSGYMVRLKKKSKFQSNIFRNMRKGNYYVWILP